MNSVGFGGGGLRKFAAMAIAFILLLSVQPGQSRAESEIVTYEAKEVVQSATLNLSDPGSQSQTGKVVLVEMYTATWCVVCALAEPQLDILSDEYGSRLAVLEYHPFPDDAGDIFGIAAGNSRMASYYGFDTFPSTVFDGTIKKIGVSGTSGDLYSQYRTYIEQRMKTEPMVNVELRGSVEGDSYWVNVSFGTDGYFSQDLSARTMIFEDDIYYNYSGSNGITNHRFVVRDIILSQYIDINATHSVGFNGTFEVDPEWNASKIGVVTFVQADYKTRYAASMAGLNPDSGDFGVWAILIVGIALFVVIVSLFVLRRKKMPEDGHLEHEDDGDG